MSYSLTAYRRILTCARDAGYRFRPFTEPVTTSERAVFLRHDVDYSLTMAVALARANHDLGVSGTFCLLLRGQVYNLLSEVSLGQARQLIDLGQRVALHCGLPDAPPADLEEFVQADFALFRRHLPAAEPVFAWHNPTPAVTDATRTWEPAGLVNAYHERFVGQMPYLSDSNLRHAPADFEAVLQGGGGPVHFLFHPLNWVAGGSSMAEIFAGTWPYVVREREEEFRTNRVYRQLFPAGMPADLLDAFARGWLRAAG